MRLEDRFLYNCITLSFKSSGYQALRGIASQDLDWDHIFKRARSEGIVSLVYQALLKDESLKPKVPDRIWQALESGYYTVAVRNSRLCQDLGAILGAFERQGLDVILLKGMALIHTIYPNPALRPMYDIDILIPKGDRDAVKEILTGLGYAQSDRYPEDFYKDDMMVDLHWELMNTTRVRSRRRSHSIDLDELWAESRPIAVEGKKARVLSPEHFLMGLCVHLSFHHGMQGLMWFTDISRFIEHYKDKIDWDRFIAKSIDYRIAKPVYYVLLYTQQVLEQDIPCFVLDRLKPKPETFVEKKVIKAIVEGRSIENIRFFFTLSTMENLFDRIIFLKEIVFPSPRVLSARHGLKSYRSLAKYYLLHFKTTLRSIFSLAARLIRA